jgi:hypothetical protein
VKTYRSKANPTKTCEAEAYDHHGQPRYRFTLGDMECDLDGRTFDEMWELDGGTESCVPA